MSSVCGNIEKEGEKLASDLKKGAVVGSTEAAYRVLGFIREASTACRGEFNKVIARWVREFLKARPTSLVMVNLVRDFLIKYLNLYRRSREEAASRVSEIIDDIVDNVKVIKDSVASMGARRIVDGDVILTHSYSSTILKTFEKAYRNNIDFKVIVTESRPIGEGIMMAEALGKLGIDVTLIVDSAVRFVMKKVSKVFLGADAVAVNGAVVNKVGSSAIALAAKESRVRVYIVAGTYKFGISTVFGELIPGVLLREPELIIPKERIPELAGKVVVQEPLFDVTPPEYIDAIITELGVIAPQAIPIVVREVYGWPPKLADLDELLEEVERLG